MEALSGADIPTVGIREVIASTAAAPWFQVTPACTTLPWTVIGPRVAARSTRVIKATVNPVESGWSVISPGRSSITPVAVAAMPTVLADWAAVGVARVIFEEFPVRALPIRAAAAARAWSSWPTR